MSRARLPEGFRVGHWSDPARRTGCTVILVPAGTIGAADVRGGAPGTRETQLFAPGNLVSEIHAIVLAGGSAFGLAAAEGVMLFLRERGIGFAVGQSRVPIVPAAVLFDLGVGDPNAFPGEAEGYAAARSAGTDVSEGSVGAGTGATVGKILGIPRASRGGFGLAAVETPAGLVAAAAAVNAFGDVVDGEGRVLAGARSDDGDFAGTAKLLREDGLLDSPLAGAATTLVAIMTDAPFDAGSLKRVAIEAHAGLARSIRPVHTAVDGDTVFAAAPGGPTPSLLDRLRIGEAAADAAATAIRRAVAEPDQSL